MGSFSYVVMMKESTQVGPFKFVVVEVTDVGFWSRLPLSPTLVHASLVHLHDDLVDFLGHPANAV